METERPRRVLDAVRRPEAVTRGDHVGSARTPGQARTRRSRASPDREAESSSRQPRRKAGGRCGSAAPQSRPNAARTPTPTSAPRKHPGTLWRESSRTREGSRTASLSSSLKVGLILHQQGSRAAAQAGKWGDRGTPPWGAEGDRLLRTSPGWLKLGRGWELNPFFISHRGRRSWEHCPRSKAELSCHQWMTENGGMPLHSFVWVPFVCF